MVRRRADQAKSAMRNAPSIWFRPSPRASAYVLGQVKVAGKSPTRSSRSQSCSTCWRSKEPSSLIDAMGCQREIAQKVIDKKADYVLALKGKSEARCATMSNGSPPASRSSRASTDTKISQDTTIDGDHGRIETRTTTVIHDVEWLQERHRWLRPEGRRHARKHTRDQRKSRAGDTLLHHLAGEFGASPRAGRPRSHWAIENSLHWVMDMVFRDDECRVRTDHAPANVTTIKHMALNLLNRPAGKQSLRGRRKAAGWDDDFLASLVTA